MKRLRQIHSRIRVAAVMTLAGFALMLADPPAALAQDADLRTLIQRMDRMGEDLRVLQKDYYRGQKTGAARLSTTKGPAGDAGRLADAEIRMSNLESEMRRLTGQLEEVRHNMQTMLQRLDGLVNDVDFRLTEIEQRLSKTPAPTAAATDGTAPTAASPEDGQATATETDKSGGETVAAAPSVLPQGTPIERYNYAYSLLKKMRLQEAEDAFQEFLNQHGDDALAGNAQYWLGETYYVRQNLNEAARAFLIGIQRYPNGKKAPDTLLKLAITLGKMGKKEDACAAFLELKDKFPNLRNQVRKRMLKEMKAGGCN